MTQTINSIDDIAARYDAVLCDVWGVIHNGRQAYPSACAPLQRLRNAGEHVILITNVPKPRGPSCTAAFIPQARTAAVIVWPPLPAELYRAPFIFTR